MIEDYFGDGSKWGVRIAYGRQVVQDGTGKAPELAKDFIGASSFILTYGDILVKPETYQQMVHRFQEGYFSGVITVTAQRGCDQGRPEFFRRTILPQAPGGKTVRRAARGTAPHGWLKPGAPAWYNAGIYIFRPSLFEFTAKLQKSPRGEYELTDAISALIAAKHTLAGLEIQGRWVDVRDPEVLANLESTGA